LEQQRSAEGKEKRSFVLDSAAFLNSSFLLPVGEAYAPPSVVAEIKSEKKHMINENIRVVQPSEESIKKVLSAAEETGDIEKLSKTDIDVLALALDVKGTIITDDFHVQNVAAFLGIPFKGITAEIREVYMWRRKCPVCGQLYPTKKTFCPKCGVKLTPPLKIRYVQRRKTR